MPQDIKDGEPAFPSVSGPHKDKNGNITYPIQYGMSLRDWFAGMALQGLIAGYGKGISLMAHTILMTQFTKRKARTESPTLC